MSMTINNSYPAYGYFEMTRHEFKDTSVRHVPLGFFFDENFKMIFRFLLE